MNIPRRRFLRLTAGACLPDIAFPARAQIAPSRPIAMIVPFEAGAAPDVYARVVAEAMRQPLGRAIVVENKQGAGGNVGTQAVAREPADANTILVTTMAVCEINPLVFDNLRWSMKDFTPVLKGVGAPLVLIAHPGVPARTLDELMTWAKSRTGTLAYASYSAGSPSHFLGAQLSATAGLDLSHVPYRGSPSQLAAILGGHSPFGFAQTQNSLEHIRSGGLRAIAVTSEERYRLLPDVPTFRELGHPAFSTSVWFGLLARAGGPADFLDKVNAAAVAAHADTRVRDALLQQGYDIIAQTGEAFAKSIAEGSARWAATVKATGFRASE